MEIKEYKSGNYLKKILGSNDDFYMILSGKILELEIKYIKTNMTFKEYILYLTKLYLLKEDYLYKIFSVDFIQAVDAINNKKILLSCECPIKTHTKLVFFILEWDEINKNFREIKRIENLNCKMICRFKKNNAILYTKYGINMIVVPN